MANAEASSNGDGAAQSSQSSRYFNFHEFDKDDLELLLEKEEGKKKWRKVENGVCIGMLVMSISLFIGWSSSHPRLPVYYLRYVHLNSYSRDNESSTFGRMSWEVGGTFSNSNPKYSLRLDRTQYFIMYEDDALLAIGSANDEKTYSATEDPESRMLDQASVDSFSTSPQDAVQGVFNETMIGEKIVPFYFFNPDTYKKMNSEMISTKMRNGTLTLKIVVVIKATFIGNIFSPRYAFAEAKCDTVTLKIKTNGNGYTTDETPVCNVTAVY